MQYGFRVKGLGIFPPIMENQMEENMEKEMETGIIGLTGPFIYIHIYIYISMYMYMGFPKLGAPSRGSVLGSFGGSPCFGKLP